MSNPGLIFLGLIIAMTGTGINIGLGLIVKRPTQILEVLKKE